MIVEVKLFAYFRDGRFTKEQREYPEDITVAQIITELEINPAEIGVLMINGRHCDPLDGLKHQDSLGIFPMIGGG